MTPLVFTGCNVTYAEGQSEYLPLPAYRAEDGLVVTCWRLSWRERLRVLIGGCVWIQLHTFNHPLQPLLPSVSMPAEAERAAHRAHVREALAHFGRRCA